MENDNTSINFRKCPVCGGIEREIIHRQRFYEGVLGDGYDVVICQKCGAGFADAIPRQCDLDRYYAEQSKYTYETSAGTESTYDRLRFEIIADHLASYLAPQARILDIGSATGGLLHAFKKRGLGNVVGIDPSPRCADLAGRLYGVEVRVGTISDIPKELGTFDLILMVGVLEHIREVGDAIDEVRSLLNPGGLFYVAVPDVEHLYEARNAPFQQFSMEHINFFSATSLCNIVGKSGFSCKKLWQYNVEWRKGIAEPVLSGVYKAAGATEFSYDRTSKIALKQYIDKSSQEDRLLAAEIDSLVDSQEPIFIWGVGALTRRLLSTTNLVRVNIVAFVDSSLSYKRRNLAGKPIISPSEIGATPLAILIASISFRSEIERQIREEMALSNRLIFLKSG